MKDNTQSKADTDRIINALALSTIELVIGFLACFAKEAGKYREAVLETIEGLQQEHSKITAQQK